MLCADELMGCNIAAVLILGEFRYKRRKSETSHSAQGSCARILPRPGQNQRSGTRIDQAQVHQLQPDGAECEVDR